MYTDDITDEIIAKRLLIGGLSTPDERIKSMKDIEFDEMITDFDGFMRRHGYYKVKEIAKHRGVEEVTVRQWIKRGQIKDTVNINGVRYIPFDYKVEYKNPKNRRKYAYGNTKNT